MDTTTIAEKPRKPEEEHRRGPAGGEERCPHCTGGRVFEPTEDTLHDEVHECPMCFGTAKRTTRTEREAIRAGRA